MSSPATTLPPAPTQAPAVDPQFEAMRSELANVKGQLNRLASRAAVPPPQPPPTPQAAQPPVTAQDAAAQFYKDPVKSTADIAYGIATQLQNNQMQSQFDTLVGLAKDKTRGSNPDLYDKYAIEVEELVRNSTQATPLLQQNTTVWMNAFNQVKGKHYEELTAKPPVDDSNRAPAIHISHDGGPASVSSRQAPPPASTKLSDEELTMAKNLRITPELYLSGKAAHENQDHKPGRPSSWDKYITTDSREQVRNARAAKRAAKK